MFYVYLCLLFLSVTFYRNLANGEGIDATQLGKLCKQTEGKTVPFDRIQAALEAVKPIKKGELTKEEFIKVSTCVVYHT